MTTTDEPTIIHKAFRATAGRTFEPGTFDCVVGAEAVFMIEGHRHRVGTIVRAAITDDGQSVTFTYRMHD